MRKIYKLFIFSILLLNLNSLNLLGDIPHVVDFKKILNESSAGKEVQDILKKKFNSASNKFKKEEEKLKKDESALISKKKLVTNEEFKKEVSKLRERVAKLQKEKNTTYDNIAKLRNDSKLKLLKLLNPIMKEFMAEKKIRIILDKSSVIAGDQSLDITAQVIDIFNKKVKTLGIK